MLRFLHALRDRMVKRGFPPDDKLRQAACRAYDAVYALSIELHYASCKPGQVARRRRVARE